MAQQFSTSGAQTAGVLLKTIPEAQQSLIARELTTRLRDSFDDAAASVAVELVSGRNEASLKDELIQVLTLRIEEGSPDNVASLLRQSPELLTRLMTIATESLSSLSKGPDTDSVKAEQLSSTADDRSEHEEVPATNQGQSSDASLYWLRFAKIALCSGHDIDHEDSLFINALEFLKHGDRPTALAARDLVFSLFASPMVAQKSLDTVRSTISSLIASPDSKLRQTLGFALWMRLLAASDTLDLTALNITKDLYWEPLLLGLRQGDGERRKMCLDILKRSVALSIEQGQLKAVTSDDNASPNTVSYQYSRYCTVFETLVLARYANLVVECQRDLSLLASADSVIQPKWLWALLGTALDVKTQDQNRKFIGDWVLRSDLFSSRFTEGLAQFLSEAFLPWAMEGHLFVSSTKLYGQALSCRHGDRLATFICNILNQTPSEVQPKLLDAMFGFLIRKHATIFAYSAVHLIRGIGQAFELNEKLSLTQEQCESLLFISSLRTLPEIATEYLIAQCWTVYNLANSRSHGLLADGLSAANQTRLQNLKASAEFVAHSLSSIHTETVVSPAYSQRDVKIAESVAKCNTALEHLSAATKKSSEELQTTLEDIWSDLEYLEYPRELLIKLPLVFFNPSVFQTIEQDDADESGLRDLVAATLPRLLDLAQRRSFLLAPLMGSLRKVILSFPSAASMLDLEESLLRVAQSPAEPSIDLRMEYATVPMLATHLKVPVTLCREHYFGKGEGYGFAAYLDLISRMSSQNTDFCQSLTLTILARWRRQKNPPPTMSAWKTTLQLEAMLLCFEQLAETASKSVLEPMLKDLYFILSLEPLPRFRYLMEWTIVRVQIRHPEFRSQTLEMLTTKDHQSNPKFIASLMKMGVMVATAESGTEEFVERLATIFIALSSSAKIVIRHEAQWAFPQLMDQSRARGWRSVEGNPAYVSLDEYIRSLPRFGDPPAERVMGKFDPVADHTMTNLVEGLWTDLDYTRPPYTTQEDFLALYADDAKQDTTSWPSSCMPLGPSIPKPPRAEPEPATEPSLLGPKQMTQEEAIALQTKGTAYLKTSLDESSARTNKHELMLVASLIENPYNLGGLSRVSEIFGAQAMYVRDPRIIAEKDFTSVSVSSHNHVDIMPLTLPDMSAWMTEKKSQGWTVVGIEQTDRSVLLGEARAQLPEKTILVLGSESLGMPAAVLAECDMLVEIPQIGVTRSLNVQTAAAIVLFEYGRQHRK